MVVIASGSVAACNLAGLVDLMRTRSKTPVVAVLTKKALRFVTKDTIRYAGGAAAVVDDDSPSLFHQPDHIWLASHARGILVYPASADFIAKLAAGLATDVAAMTFLAGHAAPRMIVPSMNHQMWSNPVVQRNIETLRAFGVAFVDTEGGLAPDVRTVVDDAVAILTPQPRP